MTIFTASNLLRIVLFFLILPLSAQQILNEMETEDISHLPEIKSIIVRNQGEGALIVKSQILNLTFESNNIIHDVEQPETGRWIVYLKPGTHRLKISAEGYLSARLRLHLKARDVKGIMVRAILSEAVDNKRDTIEVNTRQRPRSQETGIIYIKSQPEKAEIYLDNKLMGTSPHTILDVPIGEHIVKVKWNEENESEEIVTVQPDETIQLTYDISDLKYVKGKIIVMSNPLEADIYWNGQLKGKTPLIIDDIKPGKYEIIAAKNAVLALPQEILIRSNHRETVSIDLEDNGINLAYTLEKISPKIRNAQFYFSQKELNTQFYFNNLYVDRSVNYEKDFNPTDFINSKYLSLNDGFQLAVIVGKKFDFIPLKELKKDSSLAGNLDFQELRLEIIPIRNGRVYFNGIFIGKGTSVINDVSMFAKNPYLYLYNRWNELLCLKGNVAYVLKKNFQNNQVIDFANESFSKIKVSISPGKFAMVINKFSRVTNIKELYLSPGKHEITIFSHHSSKQSNTHQVMFEIEEGKSYSLNHKF